MKRWLEEEGYIFTHNKQMNQTAYFPDFLFNCDTHLVILEVDENAHSGYDEGCERKREENIRYAANQAIIFIRYNPDNKQYTEAQKLEGLREALDGALYLDNPESETVYLYY